MASKKAKATDNVRDRRTIVQVAIDALVPYARNARTHSDAQVAQIAASIREFGWTNPVLIDDEGGIIAGHGRVLAARVLGETHVPCIVLNGLTATQKRAYVLADNKLALNAGWDDEMLRLELVDLKDAGFDLALTGFDGVDVAAMLAPVESGMPSLASGDRPAFRQVIFTVHDDQWAQIEDALRVAKQAGPFIDSPNENSNGNALSRIAETYLTEHGAP